MNVVPDPVCCKSPSVRKSCNDCGCCALLGKIGFSFFDRNRGPIMLTMFFMSIIALAVSTVSLASLSTHNSVVKDTYWTRGEVDDTDIYISVHKVVFESNDGTESFSWENDECDDSLLLDDGGYCSDCQDAVSSVYRSVIINFVTLIPAVSGNLKRSTRAGDLNFTKFSTILSGTISTLTILISLSVYQQKCYEELPEETDDGRSINYNLGPGFICLLIPQILKPIEVVVNILTPVVKDEEGLKARLNPDNNPIL